MDIISYLTMIVMIALVAFSLKFVNSSILLLGILIATLLYIIGNLIKQKKVKTFNIISLFLIFLIYLIEFISNGAITEIILAIVSLTFAIIILAQKPYKKPKRLKKLVKVYTKKPQVEPKKFEVKQRVSEKKEITKKEASVFVASKTGKKYHVPECSLAKRISDANKITFKNKRSANRKGLKACKCVSKK